MQAIKVFCSWLVKEGRAPSNPLEHLARLNVKTDRRHDRRALTAKECNSLLSATQQGPTRLGMPAEDRVMLYRTALESGLRARELKTLTVGNCDLQGSPPVLTVKAAYSKHRREDVQPIPVLFAQALKDYLANRPADQLAFSTMPRLDSLAKMLRKDLEAAGILYRDESGHVADFHALRHTYITNLAQDLARHSDIKLTMNCYTHTLIEDRAKAVNQLPQLFPADWKRESGQRTLAKTGTDDEKCLTHGLTQTSDFLSQDMSLAGREGSENKNSKYAAKAPFGGKENRNCHCLTAPVSNEADGIRTRNHRIDSPIL